MKAVIALIAGWFIPGFGHLLQKKFWRAAIFFVSISAMAAMGIAMGGKIYPVYLEKPQTLLQVITHLFKKENPLTVLAFFADIGNLLLYVLSRFMAFGLGAMERATFEFGTAYIAGAGLLNYLVALDAFDIAKGKKK